MVHPGLWVTCSHGVTHIQGSVFNLGYGSLGVMAQGPTFGPLGPPVPSQEEINALQHRPAPPLFTPNFSPHPLVPPMSPYHSIPQCLTCSPHLAFSRTAFCSCRLCCHIHSISPTPPPTELHSSSSTFSDPVHLPHRQPGTSQSPTVPSCTPRPPRFFKDPSDLREAQTSLYASDPSCVLRLPQSLTGPP